MGSQKITMTIPHRSKLWCDNPCTKKCFEVDLTSCTIKAAKIPGIT